MTDGSRLYTTEGSGANNFLVQASVMGGETSPILNRFTNVDLLEISPDHSQLLVVNLVGTGAGRSVLASTPSHGISPPYG